MARSTLRRAVNLHLERIGSDVDAFLLNGIQSGRTFERLAADLERITHFPISARTLRRWFNELESVAS